MKKTLLAAALLAGFAGAAQAETSVTLYGIVDIGVGYQQIKGGGFDKQSKFGLANGVQNGSRWGLRGSEDLGDGLRAVFTLESGFNSADGQSAQGGRLFGRQATLGLASNSWGQLDFGRQTNIASKFFGSIDPFAEGFNMANIGTAFSSANTTRYDNMVLYQTPVFGGFQAGAGYSFNIDDTNAAQTGYRTNNNQRGITAGVRYVNGPINIAAAYDQLNRSETDTTGANTGDRIRAWLVGGTYDFEVVKLALAYGQTKDGWIQASSIVGPFSGSAPSGLPGNLTSNAYRDGLKVNSYLVGLSAPIGGATSIFGSWQRLDPNNGNFYATGNNDETTNVFSLGATYDLSKRTNLYAVASYAKDYAFVDGLKSTMGVVGIRHRF
ncbi:MULTISPECIES: porin [unclassified Achromobacter]|uniref:porin n=1 Tax=unclassified Achromobacter TaxID=2626865 RepID=UPI000B51611B|nr:MULTISPECIES: porin [unclassified Achromobacter]OWT68193.1 porin [Achromobacter sp. HZ34]OWT70030.1 porin [Achromobacter sp. HZ28]